LLLFLDKPKSVKKSENSWNDGILFFASFLKSTITCSFLKLTIIVISWWYRYLFNFDINSRFILKKINNLLIEKTTIIIRNLHLLEFVNATFSIQWQRKKQLLNSKSHNEGRLTLIGGTLMRGSTVIHNLSLKLICIIHFVTSKYTLKAREPLCNNNNVSNDLGQIKKMVKSCIKT